MSYTNARGRTENGLGSIRKKERERKDGSVYEYWEGRITLFYDPNTKQQITKTFTGATREEVITKIRSCGIEPVTEGKPACVFTIYVTNTLLLPSKTGMI
ncbi:MAG: hypothetical protein IKO83_06175 [Oscillospiraceae bacterium]|nr:hypothetical protein [Oscillospiraceae bacterium]